MVRALAAISLLLIVSSCAGQDAVAGCTADTDCGDNQFCDQPTQTCVDSVAVTSDAGQTAFGTDAGTARDAGHLADAGHAVDAGHLGTDAGHAVADAGHTTADAGTASGCAATGCSNGYVCVSNTCKCTADTWASWGSTFFGNYCGGCHGWANGYSGVKSRSSAVRADIVSGSMPTNTTLSQAEIDEATRWIDCGMPK